MENKITHGKICQKVIAQQTKTPTPVKNKPDYLEPTITLNFYVGSVCSEEILSISSARYLSNSLQKILSNF
jgi:hypothetical protein